MKLIKKLQECTSIEEAQPILAKLHARPSAKKLVETAILLSNSEDPQQKDHAFSFMETAIKEMEDDANGKHAEEDQLNNTKIGEMDDDDEEKTIHEEELKNNNNGSREEGSEQSTDNTEPYPQVAGTEHMQREWIHPQVKTNGMKLEECHQEWVVEWVEEWVVECLINK